MNRVFVLAGNYHEFRYWQQEDPQARKDASYISCEAQLRGIRGHLVKTGRWWSIEQRIQDLANFLVSRGDLTWNAEEGADGDRQEGEV